MSEPDPARVVDHATDHWTGVGAVALVLAGLGVLVGEPELVLSGVVGVAFAGYAATSTPPRILDHESGELTIAIDRHLEAQAPDPGDAVTVSVEVRNEGTDVLSDVRVVDGVPPELSVVDGTARHGAVLRPGERSTFSYAVVAMRGEYDWEPAAVTVADPSGSVERETRVAADATLDCSLRPVESGHLPLRGMATQYAGRIETDSGGPGVEFHSTREYRSTDPLSRIDWYRRAKTGELATLEFREERAPKVVLLIDTRQAAYRSPGPGEHHAVERSIDAAHRVFTALLDSGDRVGIATFGQSAEECWLPPRTGDRHRARGRALLNGHPALSLAPPERGLYESFQADRREELKRERIARLHRRLSMDTQVLFFSPCCDDYAARIGRRLDAYGHPVTVISPDPTTREAPLRELASMERADRLASLGRSAIRTVDWGHDETFGEAIARAQAGWPA